MTHCIKTLGIILTLATGILRGEDSPPTLSANSDETVICLPGGPCLTAEEAASRGIVVGSTSAEPQNGSRRVDLTTEPWLVESVNLSVNHPVFQRERMIWADSLLWGALPDVIPTIEVERWLTPLPENLAGKYLLVEVWATWCPPCRRSLAYLNFIAEKYADDLVVVAICETDEAAIRAMPGDHKIEDVKYSLAVDTGRRFANGLHVTGIPHAVLLEPLVGGVVWEGMPTLPGYELDGKALERFFTIGRKLKQQGRLPETSPIHFAASPATDAQRAMRRKHPTDAPDSLGAPSAE